MSGLNTTSWSGDRGDDGQNKLARHQDRRRKTESTVSQVEVHSLTRQGMFATQTTMRSKKEKTYLAGVAKDVQSGLLYRGVWIPMLLEWILFVVVYILMLLPPWASWTLMQNSSLRWLHAALLVAIHELRRFPGAAHTLLQSIHVAVLAVAVADHVVLVVQVLQVGIGSMVAIGQLTIVVLFCVSSLVRVGLVMTCC